jgi:hypothetical protein
MVRTAESQMNDASSIRVGARATSPSGGPQRILALDFTKGTLVLFMVFYHWVNYFIGPEWPSYRYLRFLTPSFIFITGFMISNVYLSKYEISDFRLIRRLITRSVKLLVIFTFLNVVRLWILSWGTMHVDLPNSGILLSTFVTGEFSGKAVAFYILVPIAHLLMLSAILMVPLRFYRYTFHVACIFLFALIVVHDLIGLKNQTLEIIAIGMLGVLAGFAPIGLVNRMVWHPFLLAFSYLFYLIAIAIWNVPYPLEVVGTLLSVSSIYLIGSSDWKYYTIRNEVILLGKYSLFGYISQIAILQLLQTGLRHVNPRGVALFISFPAAFAFTVISTKTIERARMRSATADRLYRAVFN